MRVIYLPALERHVGLAAYVAAIKLAKAHPDATFTHGLMAWWPCTGREIVEQFRAGMHDRINQAIPYMVRGTARHPPPAP
jgi:hypothetical protein